MQTPDIAVHIDAIVQAKEKFTSAILDSIGQWAWENKVDRVDIYHGYGQYSKGDVRNSIVDNVPNVRDLLYLYESHVNKNGLHAFWSKENGWQYWSKENGWQ